jgi:hypothetical protein
MQITTIGLDIAKRVFQVGVDPTVVSPAAKPAIWPEAIPFVNVGLWKNTRLTTESGHFPFKTLSELPRKATGLWKLDSRGCMAPTSRLPSVEKP